LSATLALALALPAGAQPARPGAKPAAGVPATGRGAKAVNNFGRTEDNREGALDSYVNYNTDDVPAKLELVQQEIFVNQQRLIQLQFMMENDSAVKTEFLYYPSGDQIIPGYVFTPRNMVAGKRYPAVVMVHGGFHERFSWEWFKLVRMAVDRGYVVMFPEYRGSRGYGSDYYENDYGTTDTSDVLAAAKYLRGKDFIDPAHLGVLGVSRGGMVALLAIEREQNAFQAAVDIVGLTDFVAYMSYKPEYRRLEVAHDNASFGGKGPDKNLPAYMAVSPINAVERIQTPLLVLGTTGDKIAPLQLHGGRLIDVLKAKGKVFDSHIYDNAAGGHTFISADIPEAADAMKRSFLWLDRYLMPGAR
jgi:dipeptidyl aminopeptidase/acylaminoacyl peptidase